MSFENFPSSSQAQPDENSWDNLASTAPFLPLDENTKSPTPPSSDQELYQQQQELAALQAEYIFSSIDLVPS